LVEKLFISMVLVTLNYPYGKSSMYKCIEFIQGWIKDIYNINEATIFHGFSEHLKSFLVQIAHLNLNKREGDLVNIFVQALQKVDNYLVVFYTNGVGQERQQYYNISQIKCIECTPTDIPIVQLFTSDQQIKLKLLSQNAASFEMNGVVQQLNEVSEKSEQPNKRKKKC